MFRRDAGVGTTFANASRAMQYIRPFDSLTLDDLALVGGKNASFGEMIRELGPLGVRVPSGFALTTQAYRAVVEQPGVRGALDAALSDYPEIAALLVRAGIDSLSLSPDVVVATRLHVADLERGAEVATPA